MDVSIPLKEKHRIIAGMNVLVERYLVSHIGVDHSAVVLPVFGSSSKMDVGDSPLRNTGHHHARQIAVNNPITSILEKTHQQNAIHLNIDLMTLMPILALG